MIFRIFTLTLFFALSASKAQEKVIAKKGDGIQSILIRNGYDPAKYESVFIEINKKNLSKNNHLIEGKEYVLPLKSKHKVFPLFGKDYEETDFISNKLAGAVFFLISGHGGPDPGAIGERDNNSLCEDEYAYDITLRLARNIIRHNGTAYMIVRDENDGIRDQNYLKCDEDEICYGDHKIPLDQKKRLRQRAFIANNLNKKYNNRYKRLVIIHIDSRRLQKNVDVFFYHHSKSKKGKNLAQTTLSTFKKNYNKHQPGRNYRGKVSSRDNLYMIGYTDPASLYIEIGNIKNSYDQLRIIKKSNRQALADWITEALIKDYRR